MKNTEEASAGRGFTRVAAAVAAAVARGARPRGRGRADGAVRPELAPYVRQKTVLLTTYRRDGGSGATPVSIAVEGDTAYVRSFARALKTRRAARDPRVRIAPCTVRGRRLGEDLPGRLRRLEGGSAEDRHAARLLRAKYPLLHGLLVPFAHRVVLRRRTGGTVHFAFTVQDAPARSAASGTTQAGEGDAGPAGSV